MRRFILVAALLAGGCPHEAILPAGCAKDTDCKGARICVAHACVDPATPLVSAPDGGPRGPPSAPHDAALPPPSAGPSPQFHVDAAHTGRSPFRIPTRAPKDAIAIRTGGVVFSSPAISERDLVVYGSHDRWVYGAGTGGRVLWRFQTGDLVWSSPALSAGIAYVGSDDDHLYAIALEDGALRWQFRAGPCRTAIGVGPEAARCDVDGVTVAPDGTIYAAADGLYALEPGGRLKWKFSPGATHCASTPAVGADGLVYVGCQDDALYAVDPTGVKRWEFRAGDDIDSSPAVAPDGTVYVGSDDHKLYALAPGGALKFALLTGGAVRSSPALAVDGTVYVGSFDGVLYAVRSDGTVAWTFRTADRILSSPLVDAAGMVVVGSQDDRLYALWPDGRLAWSILLDGDVDGTPALGSDGTIYVGADDHALHGIR